MTNFLHGKTGYALHGNVDYIIAIDCQISLYQYEDKHKGGINPKAFQYHNKAFRLKINRIKKDHYPYSNYSWYERPINKLWTCQKICYIDAEFEKIIFKRDGTWPSKRIF